MIRRKTSIISAAMCKWMRNRSGCRSTKECVTITRNTHEENGFVNGCSGGTYEEQRGAGEDGRRKSAPNSPHNTRVQLARRHLSHHHCLSSALGIQHHLARNPTCDVVPQHHINGCSLRACSTICVTLAGTARPRLAFCRLHREGKLPARGILMQSEESCLWQTKPANVCHNRKNRDQLRSGCVPSSVPSR